MSGEVLKLITIALGATGFWKLIELLFRQFFDQKLKRAETINQQSQAEKNIVEKWIKWSDFLEKRIREFENNTDLLEQIIEKQRKKIKELEVINEKLEAKYQQLLNNYREDDNEG